MMKATFLLISFLFLLLACNDQQQNVKALQSQIDSLQQQIEKSYKPGFGEFIHSFWEFTAAKTGLLYHIVRYYINGHFGYFEDIFQSMLCRIIFQSSGRWKNNDRGIRTEKIKKTERA